MHMGSTSYQLCLLPLKGACSLWSPLPTRNYRSSENVSTNDFPSAPLTVEPPASPSLTPIGVLY